MGDWFYPLYMKFLERGLVGISALEEINDRLKSRVVPMQKIKELLYLLLHRNRTAFSSFASDLLITFQSDFNNGVILQYFIDALRNPDLLKLDRFCFLIAGIIIRLNMKEM
jgi:hypothetical protein